MVSTNFCNAEEASTIDCKIALHFDEDKIVAPAAWKRVPISTFTKNPYALKDEATPLIISQDGSDLVLVVEVSKLPTFLEAQQKATNDTDVQKWLARVKGRFEVWSRQKEQATGLATIWNKAEGIRGVANNSFFSVFDERLYDRVTQQGRRFAVISLDPSLGLKKILAPVSPMPRLIIRPTAKAGKQRETVSSSIGLIFQRYSHAGILTLVEDNTFDKRMKPQFAAIKKFLDSFVDKNPLPLSSVENPEMTIATSYQKQLSFTSPMLDFGRNLKMELYRYRDGKGNDHIVIENVHEISPDEFFNDVIAESLKGLNDVIKVGEFLLPKNLHTYPFLSSNLKAMSDILVGLSEQEKQAFSQLSIGDTLTQTFRFEMDRKFLITPNLGYLQQVYTNDGVNITISVLKTEKGLLVLYIRPTPANEQ